MQTDEPRISVVTLGVTDMPRARAFYERLGWRPSASSNERFTLFRSKGVLLALYGAEALAEDATVPPGGEGFRSFTVAQNVARKEDVATGLARAVAAGGKLVKPAQDVFWGGHSGYFADPDGHLWEVVWNPHWPLGPDGGVELTK
jgi:catechol 2,3-dioxygenase-like lactoylglutathione lyase family enzyme